jgi:hypothetical protein
MTLWEQIMAVYPELTDDGGVGGVSVLGQTNPMW